ncbi:hypothetical protein PR202_ga20625 [Eleusine coracana subsp. coracana]|uniref:Uncharacterized protein n=1 Tax=Eleusine coracana subsp. coracana TaxID=191504 RepID=A0AAV5CX50_ELECO|nr:hypothetical protein PR202_ga20625 [Eleusine coracana subsp. coracana]
MTTGLSMIFLEMGQMKNSGTGTEPAHRSLASAPVWSSRADARSRARNAHSKRSSDGAVLASSAQRSANQASSSVASARRSHRSSRSMSSTRRLTHNSSLIASALRPVLAPMAASTSLAAAFPFHTSSETAKASRTSAASTTNCAGSCGKEKAGRDPSSPASATSASSAASMPDGSGAWGKAKAGKSSSPPSTSKTGGPTAPFSSSSSSPPPPTEAEPPAPPSCGGISLGLADPSRREARRSSIPASSLPLSWSPAAAVADLGAALLVVRTEVAIIVERRGEGDLDGDREAGDLDHGDPRGDGDGDLDPSLETQRSGGDEGPSSSPEAGAAGGSWSSKALDLRSGEPSSASSSIDQSMGGGRTQRLLAFLASSRQWQGKVGAGVWGNFGRCGSELGLWEAPLRDTGGIYERWGTNQSGPLLARQDSCGT